MNDQHYAILQATLAAEAAAALAASDGKTISIYENLWGMGWSRNEIRRAANFVGDVEGARNARIFIDSIPAEMDRAERVVGPGTKGDWRTNIRATLIKRGWSPGECAAALHFVLFVHFSNKEIIEQTRQQSKARREARREAIKCATTQN